MKESTLRVVIIEPGEKPREAMIEDSYETRRALVGGFYQVFPLDAGGELDGICADNGWMEDGRPNRYCAFTRSIIPGVFICTASFIANEDRVYRSLTDEEVARVTRMFYFPLPRRVVELLEL